MVTIHKAADQSALGMKAIVLKLTGDAKLKFELDHKISAEQFCRLVLKLSTDETGVNLDSFEKYCVAFKKALNDGAEPFKGDLENETYKNIIAAFRSFDPNATE